MRLRYPVQLLSGLPGLGEELLVQAKLPLSFAPLPLRGGERPAKGLFELRCVGQRPVLVGSSRADVLEQAVRASQHVVGHHGSVVEGLGAPAAQPAALLQAGRWVGEFLAMQLLEETRGRGRPRTGLPGLSLVAVLRRGSRGPASVSPRRAISRATEPRRLRADRWDHTPVRWVATPGRRSERPAPSRERRRVRPSRSMRSACRGRGTRAHTGRADVRTTGWCFRPRCAPRFWLDRDGARNLEIAVTRPGVRVRGERLARFPSNPA